MTDQRAPASEFGVILVPSTSAALRGEKVLLRAGLQVKLIPVPREISSNCGISIRFAWPERDQVEIAMAESKVPIDSIHPL